MDILAALKNTAPTLWVQILLILCVTAILGVMLRRIIGNLRQIKSTPEWVKILCETFYTPSAWLVWGYGILLTLEATVDATDLLISPEMIAKGRNILFIFFATWILLIWKTKYEKVLRGRIKSKPSRAQDEALIMAIGKVISIFIVAVSGMIVLDILEVQLTALLAFGGMSGVAIGFAGKDIVANFFSGFMIFINRPFTVGEWIMSPNKNFEGVVEDIGWYMTRIRTFARRPTYIPNAIFVDAIVENPGRMYNRRIKQTVGIRYQDVKKTEPIVEDIRKMLRSHSDIDHDKTLLVHFLAFGPSSLDIEVYCFTKTTDWEAWRDIQQGVFLQIANIIESHGAEIAFPTSTIHLAESQPRHSGRG